MIFTNDALKNHFAHYLAENLENLENYGDVFFKI